MGETILLAQQNGIVFRCLAGLQAGVLGGIGMLLYQSVDAALHRQRWSNPEVLLGTAVYGSWAIWHASIKAVLAGIGFQIFLAGLAGVLFALICGSFRILREGRILPLLAALSFAMAWYWLCYLQVFPRIAPLIPQYTSRSVAIAAHALLGLVLSRIPAMYRELSGSSDATL